jgi:replication fork protection complex subunit Tof1/Swi1
MHDDSEVEDEATDTTLSPQYANGVHPNRPAAFSITKSQDVEMADDDEEEEDDDEDTPVARRPIARKRGAFVVDSDSE